MSDPLIGKQIGPYRIEREIGRGGMGVVYQGRQLSLNRKVAIKVLPPQMALDSDFVERFRQEARVIAGLAHENLVYVYDIETADGAYFIIMEYVEGENLRARLKSRRLGVEEVRTVGVALARALGYAHQHGIVHRDVKSQNVMVTSRGEVKLMDFGIARVAGSGIKTDAGAVLGTPEYMAPERVRSGEVTPRTDIYSLGVLLYELATGQLPFNAPEPFAIALKHLSEEPVAPRSVDPTVPEWLNRVILTAMAKDPAQRHASARELEEELTAGGKVTASRRLEPLVPGLGVAAAAPSGGGAAPGSQDGASGIPGVPSTSAGPRRAFPADASPPAAASQSPPLPGPGPTEAVPGGTSSEPVRFRPSASAMPSGGRRAVQGARSRLLELPLWAFLAATGAVLLALALLLPRFSGRGGIESGGDSGAVGGGGQAVVFGESAPKSGAPERVRVPVPFEELLGGRGESAAAAPPPAEPEAGSSREEPSKGGSEPPSGERNGGSEPPPYSKVFTCVENVAFQVRPQEAMVAIAGLGALGLADHWDARGGGRLWKPGFGTYFAELSHPNHETAWVKIVLRRGGGGDTCFVDVELEKTKRKWRQKLPKWVPGSGRRD